MAVCTTARVQGGGAAPGAMRHNRQLKPELGRMYLNRSNPNHAAPEAKSGPRWRE